MFHSHKIILQFNNLNLGFESKTILDNASGIVTTEDRIGLVGINGSGKSTLLKALAGLIQPKSGSINRSGSIGYLPQLNLELYRTKMPVYEYLEKQYSNWWEVLVEYDKHFESPIMAERQLSTLSGGELTKLNLALVFAQKPDLLLLDEPSNHLDLNSLIELQSALKAAKFPFIIVSHNSALLNEVTNTTWAIANKKLNAYGGNYDFYKANLEAIENARQRKYSEKTKELKKLVNIKERERKRAQRSAKVGEIIKKTHDRSTDRFAYSYFKNASQISATKKKALLDSKEEKLRAESSLLKSLNRKQIYINFGAKTRQGLVISIRDAQLVLPNGDKLLEELNFDLYHGDRIAILGNNGTGKTTLIKQLTYHKSSLLTGEIKYGSEYSSIYVDQKYDLIESNISVAKNIQINNPHINYENIRRVLGNLGFPNEYDIDTPATNLSGGETARLCFAIATSSNADLLILDEPTNNLDIETVEIISKALFNYKGTLIVVSHDLNFLKNAGIEQKYSIRDKRLVKVL